MMLAISASAWAAEAPKTADQLAEKAAHVVTATVISVDSKNRRSEVETAVGVHRDRVFTLSVSVDSVEKGDGLATGATIEVRAWQALTRIPPLPGPQGQDVIPKVGDRVTLYLHDAVADAEPFEALTPNGIQIEEDADASVQSRVSLSNWMSSATRRLPKRSWRGKTRR